MASSPTTHRRSANNYLTSSLQRPKISAVRSLGGLSQSRVYAYVQIAGKILGYIWSQGSNKHLYVGIGWQDVPLCAGQSHIFITFYTSCKLRRCPTLLWRVRLDFWNACFIIWHLLNSCARRQQWGLPSGGGAGCLIMSIKLGCRRRIRPHPTTRNNANQVRMACSKRHGGKHDPYG